MRMADNLITGHNLIAGTWHAEGKQTFTNVNPRTKAAGDIAFHNATFAEIDRAVTAAAEAFTITRTYSATKLADFLDAAAAEIEALGSLLLETADWETGLGLPRLTGERGRTTGQLRAFANLLREGFYVEAIIDTALPERQPLPRPNIRRMLIPLGPVAVFGASNFPLAFSVAGGDTASALAAGCPVIVKAHPGHPAASELVARAITRAVQARDFPPGFFSMVQGNGIDTGQTLVEHPLLAAVGFTGSLRGGRAIFDTAARRPRPIPVYAEMGSINPVVILPDAIKQRGDAIAAGLAQSVMLGSGQFCTNPGLVFVIDGPETAGFVDALTAQLAEQQPGVLLNEGIERGLATTVANTSALPDVDTLTGGAFAERDYFCYPNTVLQTTSAAFRANEALQTEHFGPVTLLVRCKTPDDLATTLDVLAGNLTATIHAEDIEPDTAGELLSLLREKAGRLIWNQFPTGVEVSYAMQHGGPYPATTAPGTTSVGMTAIKRFLRPVAYQNTPDALLPDALKDDNPLDIWRIVDGRWTKADLPIG